MKGCCVLLVLGVLVALSEAISLPHFLPPSSYVKQSSMMKNFKLKESLSRQRRQVSRYSKKYNDYIIESAKVLVDAVGTDFCGGDPFKGVQCFEENICVAWEEICDGYQSCALGQLPACLNQTLQDYGYEDKSKCAGEERQEWCALRQYQPTRCGEDIELKAQGKATITSPNYPARYEDDMHCYWSVKVPEGRKITVSVRDFQTEPEVDYVSMGNGLKEDPKEKGNYIIYRHTGLSVPKLKNFTTSGNEFFVTFISDDWDREAGFAIDVADSVIYEPEVPVAKSPFPFKVNKDCNEKIELAVGESKKIMSPNHPDYYNNSQACTWSVKITPGRRVGITFTRMDVENILDRVEVGSGAEPASPEEVYTGRDIPEPFVSSTSELWVRLVTNGALRRTGFEAIVRDQPYNDCGGDIVIPAKGSASIASPYYPDRSYTLDSFCLWKISAPAGSELSFFFKDFRTERLFDSLSLGSGKEPSVNGENYAITLHTGNKLPEPANITIGDNLAWLTFSSDYSTADKGFFVDVFDAAVQKSDLTFKPKEGPKTDTGCGDIIAVKETLFELSSPGSPTYHPMMECTWLLSFPIAADLSVRFMRFETELSNDLFELGTGNDPDDPGTLILSHSGAEFPHDFYANSTDLWIRFRTNFIVQRKGWIIQFDSFPDTTCGGSFYVPTGGRTAIAAPGYPSGYPRNTKCTYVINAPPGKRMRGTVQTFQTEGARDTLTVGDGCDRDQNGTIYIDEHFGFTLPEPASFLSDSGAVWMEFDTDVYGSDFKGFAISFEDTDLTFKGPKDGNGNPIYQCDADKQVPLSNKPGSTGEEPPKAEPKAEQPKSEPETSPEGSGMPPGM